MTEKQQQLFQLIKQSGGVTLNDLSQELGLSQKQVYQRLLTLQNKGYTLVRKDFSTGDIQFEISNNLRKNTLGEKILYTLPGTVQFRAVFISDIHIGNICERVDILNALYEYCIKNNIHIIFCCGDFLDRKVGKESNYSNDYIDNIERALKIYPYDKSITTFTILGDHDYSYINKGNIDFSKILLKRRADVYPVGYGSGIIKIKNDQIALKHPATPRNQAPIDCQKVFKGHNHISKQKEASGNNFSISVPTCSNIIIDENKTILPGILDVTFDFYDNGCIKNMSSITLIYHNGFLPVSCYEKPFDSKKANKNIMFEESPKQLKKVINNI